MVTKKSLRSYYANTVPTATKNVTDKLTEVVVDVATAAIKVTKKNPKVVLDKQFVPDYLQKQNQQQSRSDAELISLVDSSDEESENSVVFVGEEKPPEESPKTECDRLRKQNKDLRHRMRKLEIHVEALQKRVIDNGEPSAAPINIAPNEIAPIENAPAQNISNDEPFAAPINIAPIGIAPIENAPAQNNSNVLNISNCLNTLLNDEWILNQIDEIQNEGNLTLLASELAEKIEQNE